MSVALAEDSKDAILELLARLKTVTLAEPAIAKTSAQRPTDKAEAKDLMDKFRGHADARFEESMVNNRVVNVIFRNLDIDGSGGVDFDECWLAFRQAMPEDLEAQIDSMSARSFVDALDHLEALNLAIQGNDFSGIDVNDMMEELEGYADELEQ